MLDNFRTLLMMFYTQVKTLSKQTIPASAKKDRDRSGDGAQRAAMGSRWRPVETIGTHAFPGDGTGAERGCVDGTHWAPPETLCFTENHWKQWGILQLP